MGAGRWSIRLFGKPGVWYLETGNLRVRRWRAGVWDWGPGRQAEEMGIVGVEY